MSKSALLDLVPAARRKIVYHEADGRTLIETRQDVEPILDAAKVLADEAPGKDFRHAAFIPDVVLDRAFREGWFHDAAAWKRWANDPANRGYRTWPGRL
jgi:hypothetical protein